MALSNPRNIFGIHSVTPYSRTTGEFYGEIRVLGSSSLSLEGELIKLNGGSQRYPWAIEDGLVSATMSLVVREYPDFLFTLFLGKAPTAVGADTAGVVSTIANKYGTSTVAATGLASVSVIPSTGAADLKFGKYVVKVASATTIDIFMSTDIDHTRGTDESFDNDLLRVSTAQTITTGGNTDIASLGLRFTGGAGVIGMTTGHTATFEVLPPSTSSMSVVIGATTDSFPEFGAIVMAKARGTGEYFEIDAYRCKAAGMPIKFEENAWSEAEIKVELFYDSTLNGIMKVRNIVP